MLTIVIIMSKLGVYVSVSFVKYNNQIMRLGYSWKVHLKKKKTGKINSLFYNLSCVVQTMKATTRTTKVISSDYNVFYEENLTKFFQTRDLTQIQIFNSYQSKPCQERICLSCH